LKIIVLGMYTEGLLQDTLHGKMRAGSLYNRVLFEK
jgi:hypothetical protein